MWWFPNDSSFFSFFPVLIVNFPLKWTATSSKDDLHRRIGGRCSSNNMKVVFKVCCAPETETQNATQTSLEIASKNNGTVSKMVEFLILFFISIEYSLFFSRNCCKFSEKCHYIFHRTKISFIFYSVVWWKRKIPLKLSWMHWNWFSTFFFLSFSFRK